MKRCSCECLESCVGFVGFVECECGMFGLHCVNDRVSSNIRVCATELLSYMYMCVCVCVCAYMYVCMYICMYVCTYVCMYVYACINLT
jgi:hypothetical protein